MADRPRLLLIDGHSILNRAFFGLPDLTNSEGVHTNAVYGFLNILFKILDSEQPDYLTVAFDVSAPTFRHKKYPAYKGTRHPMAPELKEQVPMMKEMLHAMGVVTVEKAGLEADDILGTISHRAEEAGADVTIVSGDRDLLQLATEHVCILIPKTKKTGTEIETYYASDVKEKYLVTPTEFIDVKALWGDTADNIPGVPGIGEKTATNIISQYHSIGNAHDHAAELKPPRASKNIVEYWDQAKLSKWLATIDVHADIEYDMDSAKLGDLYTSEAYDLCRKWDFNNLLDRFSTSGPSNADIEGHFHKVTNQAEAEETFGKMQSSESRYIGVGLYLKGHSAAEAGTICGVSLSDGAETYFICAAEEIAADFLKEQLQQMADESAGRHILSFMELKPALSQIHFDDRKGAFDVQVAAYLLDPLPNTYPTENIARDYLGLMIPAYVDLFGKKKPEAVWEDPESEENLLTYACYEAYTAARVPEVLNAKLTEEDMRKLYDEVELPLVFTLYDMETAGIEIEGDALQAYGDKLVGRIAELESKIYQEAGEEFNINSPKQLGQILFGKLMLPGAKKTKTGYSTAAEVLENLADEYPIVADILEYRQLTKLKSTYADGLHECIAKDGRIHTTFQQTVTATGRLSSTDPNLQNIPIREELGKEIRKVFPASKGCVFVDSDYSQIELRVLAHLSGDQNLIQAYLDGKDIHRSTASLVFHVPFDEVTDLQRHNAKAVNFGIVYGISAFGLSKDLHISRKEAQAYIDDYFEAYPQLHTYLNGLVDSAKEKGYAVTMFGRRRPIPELKNSNFAQRQFGERVAMNSPIQGTAADIIKIAMNRVHDRLAKEGLKSRLILQVHDELLVEAREDEKDDVIRILDEEMHHAVDMAVPLEIDTHTGYNWYDAK